MTKKPEKKRLNVVAIRLDDEMLAKFRNMAEEQHRPLANFIVAILKDYLEEVEAKDIKAEKNK